MLRRAPTQTASHHGSRASAVHAQGVPGAIAALRVGVGLAMLASPDLVPRLLGVDRVTAGRLRWLGLMLGGRDLGLGLGVLASGAVSSRPWLLTQAFVDSVDMVALLTAARRRTVAPLPAGAFAATAVATAATELRLALTVPANLPRAGRGDHRMR